MRTILLFATFTASLIVSYCSNVSASPEAQPGLKDSEEPAILTEDERSCQITQLLTSFTQWTPRAWGLSLGLLGLETIMVQVTLMICKHMLYQQMSESWKTV